jgi:hypothetical protein
MNYEFPRVEICWQINALKVAPNDTVKVGGRGKGEKVHSKI